MMAKSSCFGFCAADADEESKESSNWRHERLLISDGKLREEILAKCFHRDVNTGTSD